MCSVAVGGAVANGKVLVNLARWMCVVGGNGKEPGCRGEGRLLQEGVGGFVGVVVSQSAMMVVCGGGWG